MRERLYEEVEAFTLDTLNASDPTIEGLEKDYFRAVLADLVGKDAVGDVMSEQEPKLKETLRKAKRIGRER